MIERGSRLESFDNFRSLDDLRGSPFEDLH